MAKRSDFEINQFHSSVRRGFVSCFRPRGNKRRATARASFITKDGDEDENEMYSKAPQRSGVSNRGIRAPRRIQIVGAGDESLS